LASAAHGHHFGQLAITSPSTVAGDRPEQHATDRAAPARQNRTGMPDQLKARIEALSGLTMDDVQVHLNSAKPAQLRALAYARGTNIYVGPGQERYLPHEAWHVVQQKQGRVPVTGSIHGQPLNDQRGLEREADLWGHRAAQLHSPVAPVHTPGRNASLPARAPIQRTPEAALSMLGDAQNQDIASLIGEIRRILANIRLIGHSLLTMRNTSRTYLSIKAVLRKKVFDLLKKISSKQRFIEKWNEGVGGTLVEYNDNQESDPEHSMDVETGSDLKHSSKKSLATWYDKAIKDKQMVPGKKLAKMLPSILSEDVPVDTWIALKLFFAHTANFVPQDRLGRDFLGDASRKYFRSESDPIRDAITETLKNSARRKTAGHTYQAVNPSFYAALQKFGKLAKKVDKLKFSPINSQPEYSYTHFLPVQAGNVGPLGLLQHVYRALRGITMKEPQQSSTATQGSSWFADGLGPIVSEDLLAPGSEMNYHDLMLQDRARLVREVAEAIKQGYSDKRGGIKVVSIQSGEHPSLILDLEYLDAGPQVGMDAWRTQFIQAFNEAAEQVKANTRLTERDSFGFLFPTASSVGGPVRIWPGLVPPALFKQIIFTALNRLPQRFQKPSNLSVTQSGTSGPILHIEALKTAVRYAQQAMGDSLEMQGPRILFDWIKVRLDNNLMKAKSLLKDKASEGATENHYLKSALVIENLMEYSYLLETLNTQQPTKKDSYPEYLNKKLFGGSQTNPNQITDTFYLDSGMQAITVAHLVARQWIVANRSKSLDKAGDVSEPPQKIVKRTSKKASENNPILKTIDLYSYFEYGKIDKSNLNLEPQNRKNKTDHFTKIEFEQKIPEIFKGEKPAIITADLNPVFTDQTSPDQRVPYEKVFSDFSGKGDSKNKATIPILDITNASLGDVAKLNLGEGYENFMIVESLSKHQQIGADKFTMGRLSAVGTKEFINFAKAIVDPIEKEAYDRLTAAYRLRMDQVFYGDASANRADYQAQFLKIAPQYNAFMEIMGLGSQWHAILNRDAASTRTDRDQQAILFQESKKLLSQAFQTYTREVASTQASNIDLAGAFRALPSAEQQRLLQQTQQQIDSRDIPLQISSADMRQVSQTGITNIGNTCYLASALNMLAFSPYHDLFAQRDRDPQRHLRAQIQNILADIQRGNLISRPVIVSLLLNLHRQGLLEAPNAFAAGRGPYAQRDPAELMEYILNAFGADQPAYRFGQTYHTRMGLGQARGVLGANANKYSPIDEQGHFATEHRPDWILKLPIDQVDHLGDAVARYLQPERLGQARGVRQGNVIEGPIARQIAFGAQAPAIISIQLIRWGLQRGQVVKDNRPINMPARFTFNNFVYQLKTVIYHHGANPGEGHYTTSTLSSEQGWQYRDDQNVYSDQNVAERSQFGYLYTYARERATTPTDSGLMNMNNPRQMAIQHVPANPSHNPLALVLGAQTSSIKLLPLYHMLSETNPELRLQQGNFILDTPFSTLMHFLSSQTEPGVGRQATNLQQSLERSLRASKNLKRLRDQTTLDSDVEEAQDPAKRRRIARAAHQTAPIHITMRFPRTLPATPQESETAQQLSPYTAFQGRTFQFTWLPDPTEDSLDIDRQ
jgi:hypothetical protein